MSKVVEDEHGLIATRGKAKTNTGSKGKKTGKDLEEELKKLRLDNATLTSKLLSAEIIVADLLNPCDSCKKRMVTVDWNSSVYIMFCDNDNCPKFRNPVRRLSKDEINFINAVVKEDQS